MNVKQRLRQLTKLAIATSLQYTGLLSYMRSRIMRDKAAVLMYHRIIPQEEAKYDYAPNGMVVTTSLFEKHIQYLAKHYHTVTINELCDILDKKEFISKKPLLAVTFDDGWLDNYTNALPILNKYNVPATIFIGCNFIDNKEWYWLERVKFVLAHAHKTLIEKYIDGEQRQQLQDLLSELNLDSIFQNFIPELGLYLNNVVQRVNKMDASDKKLFLTKVENIAELSNLINNQYFMDWEQVKSLSDKGIEIGAHTITHTDLTSLSIDLAEKEITESKSILESKLGYKINNFAFPYGKNNNDIQNYIKNSGYRSACSTINGLVDDGANHYHLKRINMHTDVSFTSSMFGIRILAL